MLRYRVIPIIAAALLLALAPALSDRAARQFGAGFVLHCAASAPCAAAFQPFRHVEAAVQFGRRGR